MKTTIFLILGFIALVTGQIDQLYAKNPYKHLLRARRNGETESCVPGSTKKIDCNTCLCLNDGSGWGCTRKGCAPPIHSVHPETQADEPSSMQRVKRSNAEDSYRCVPNGVFDQDCNICICTPDGRSSMCTLRACPPRNGF